MNNFVYYAPTKVLFGKDTENEAGALVREAGGKNVLVHYGGGSAVKSGLLDRVCRSLDAAGLSHVKLGGVVPNPRLSKVYEGIALCKEKRLDFILAVGGGSVIDSAKAIGYGLAADGDVWDFYAKTRVPAASAPVGCVLTIAATGSEMSDSSVITRENGALKRGCNNAVSRPKFALMNPALTLTLPWYQTASGAVDILMHTLERWFDNMRTATELTDAIAVSVIKTVMRNVLVLKEDNGNYNAAAELMWAGSLSHNGLCGCGGSGGTPRGAWA
ncbi:MAG: iron-containing alcohol dehydrogenase, partial [Spirochaetaceae bacterium]|nr:iron-containing alcohol dehydrogenase [Spirochaetaceae bacterium]